MKAFVLALTLLASTGLLLTARLAWPAGGSSDTVPLLHAPAATATPTPTPAPSGEQAGPDTDDTEEPQALTHRQSVLDRFVCANCHSDDGGWPAPDDHASLEQECVACHAPAPAPSAIAVHRTPEQTVTDPLCFSCHGDFAGQVPLTRPAAEAEECSSCHEVPDQRVLPGNHEGRSLVTCMVCHETRTLAQPKVPHKVKGWEECSFCHSEGRLAVPERAHEGLKDNECLRCHDTSLTPPDLPLRMLQLATQKDGCAGCHAADALAPLPPSHEGRTEALCGVCHTAVRDKAPLIPHTPGRSAACLKCHSAERLAAPTGKHRSISEKTCTACHATQPGAVPAIPHDTQDRTSCTDCHSPAAGPAAPARDPP